LVAPNTGKYGKHFPQNILRQNKQSIKENGHKVHKVYKLKKYKEKEYACGSLKMKSKMENKVGIKKANREKLVRTRFYEELA
jgi:hypothetical protein